MASYMMGDDMLGAFLPGLFSWKLAKKTIAKFDPTSSTAVYGKAMKAGIIGGLNFIPVVGTGLSVAAGAGFMLKSSADQNKRLKTQQAQQQQAIIQNAMVPTPASPEIGSAGNVSASNASTGPLIGIGAVVLSVIAALTML
jgi:hypothetical protein